MPGVIERATLPEYTELLRTIGFEPEVWQRLAAHENEHMIEALQSGVEPVYLVRFSRRKKEDGSTSIGMYPSVSFEFPTNIPDEDRRRILRSILEAPEEPSPSDKRQMEEE